MFGYANRNAPRAYKSRTYDELRVSLHVPIYKYIYDDGAPVYYIDSDR